MFCYNAMYYDYQGMSLQARESPFAAHARNATPLVSSVSQLRCNSMPTLHRGSSPLRPPDAKQIGPHSHSGSRRESSSCEESQSLTWSLDVEGNSAKSLSGENADAAALSREGSDPDAKPLGYFAARFDHSADTTSGQDTRSGFLDVDDTSLSHKAKQTGHAQQHPLRASSPSCPSQVLADTA